MVHTTRKKQFRAIIKKCKVSSDILCWLQARIITHHPVCHVTRTLTTMQFTGQFDHAMVNNMCNAIHKGGTMRNLYHPYAGNGFTKPSGFGGIRQQLYFN